MKWIFLIAVIGIAAAAVICAETHDRKDDKRQKRVLQEGVRCTGHVSSVEKRRMSESRSAYLWRMKVDFEFEGTTYTIEYKSVARPVRAVGDTVAVFVDRKDPWKSIISP